MIRNPFFEYMGTEKEKIWDSSDFTTTPGKIRVCALEDSTGYSLVNGIPEYRGYAYLDNEYSYYDWRNGEVYEVIISYEYPVEVITFEAYAKSYSENKYIKTISDFTKYAIPIAGTILIVFVQIAIIKKIFKKGSDEKCTKKLKE